MAAHVSTFNNQIVLTQDNWAVTMICDTRRLANHAMLIVEKVTETDELIRQKSTPCW